METLGQSPATGPEAKPIAPLSVTAAGRWLGIERHRLSRAVKRGEVKTIELAGRKLIPSAELRRLLTGEGSPPIGS